jgi:hypothetical protein
VYISTLFINDDLPRYDSEYESNFIKSKYCIEKVRR